MRLNNPFYFVETHDNRISCYHDCLIDSSKETMLRIIPYIYLMIAGQLSYSMDINHNEF